MKLLSKTICAVALAVSLLGGWRVFADDKPTSLSDAQAAVEANLRTPEGKAYDERLGKEFMEKHLATMKKCKESAGKDLESFWMLMKLDKDGAVKEVLLHPTTKMGTCAREALLKGSLSTAPATGILGKRVHEIVPLRLIKAASEPRESCLTEREIPYSMLVLNMVK